MTERSSPLLRNLWEDLRLGKMSRREFMARAAALGVGAPVALVLVNSIGMDEVAAQDALSERPSFGTEEQIRGAGGELSVRQWLAPDHLFMHHNTIERRYPMAAAQVSSLIVEPLLSYAPDGLLLPTLVTEVPTRENGGLSEDLRTVTLNLREGVLWSDGEPFTADDVVWTWRWITEQSNASHNSGVWSAIQEAVAISPARVELIYAKPSLGWFVPLAGGHAGGILPSHVWRGKNKDAVNAEFGINPIGTGPYKVEEFGRGDYIVCSINESYRERNKPYFATVRFQGGGDAATDAQAVLQDGDGDVAALPFIDPELLLEMASASSTGKLIAAVQTYVERIVFNFSDPNTEVDGERSSLEAPHPFLTDKTVRQAMAMAIDRESIASEIFVDADLHPAARNILTGISALESQNTTYQYDIDEANDLLDAAGWVREGEKRTKEGIELAVSYYTAVGEDNALVKRFRPEVQAAVKARWEAIGIKVKIGQIKGSVFFDARADNEHSFAHFYRDIEMWSNAPTSPFPDSYFEDWYAGPGNSNVAQRANDWSGWNLQRYVNPDFDDMYKEVRSTIDPERAVELFIAMNDLIVGDFVVVPLVARPEFLYAFNNRIAAENVGASSWEPLSWNIANWRTVAE
jgi:peptide/nickel transport system substrate-binding protein